MVGGVHCITLPSHHTKRTSSRGIAIILCARIEACEELGWEEGAIAHHSINCLMERSHQSQSTGILFTAIPNSLNFTIVQSNFNLMHVLHRLGSFVARVEIIQRSSTHDRCYGDCLCKTLEPKYYLIKCRRCKFFPL